MVSIDQIETACRAQPGGWATLFRRHGTSWQCLLFPRRLLSEGEFKALIQRLETPSPGRRGRPLTLAERQRNKVRAIADRADMGRRYG